jgi:hypothetical protein
MQVYIVVTYSYTLRSFVLLLFCASDIFLNKIVKVAKCLILIERLR